MQIKDELKNPVPPKFRVHSEGLSFKEAKEKGEILERAGKGVILYRTRPFGGSPEHNYGTLYDIYIKD